MSKKTKYSQEDELIVREYLTAMIKGAYRANDNEEDIVNEIIEELVLPSKLTLLNKALRYKIRTCYLIDFSK